MDEGRQPAPHSSGINGVGVPASSSVLCLRVTLLDSPNQLWRRVRVPGRMTLRRLHAVLRCVLGFPDVEAHRFRIGDLLYGTTAPGGTTRDSRWVMVGELVGSGIAAFRYEIAAPEVAVHEVRVEAILDEGADAPGPLCLGGEGVWPERALGPVAPPDRVAFMVTDPAVPAFDLEAVNVALARLR